MTSKISKNLRVVFCQDRQLDLVEGVEFVKSPKCGAINTFTGTIRDTDDRSTNHNDQIIAIYYEAYESMAMRQILDILDSIINPSAETGAKSSDLVDPNSRAYVAVRLGKVLVQESSIIICVSSTNRIFSHKATMAILERIKSSVAIWKKIIFSDGFEKWTDMIKSEAYWLRDGNGTQTTQLCKILSFDGPHIS